MVTPILNYVLVRPFQNDGISDGGIIVPDSFKQDSNKVEVVVTGNGTKATPMIFKRGDIVFKVYGDHEAISEILIDGVKHLLIPQSHLIAKLT